MEFNQALGFVFGEEGGLANNKSDRGGKTNYGISQRAYPSLNIQNITREQAAGLYKRDYWDAMNLDNQPESLRLVAMDTAVQHGVPTAKKMLNEAGGDPARVIEMRKSLYQNLVERDPSQAQFAKGWANRIGRLESTLQPQAEPAAKAPQMDSAAIQGQVAAMYEKGLGNVYILEKLRSAGLGEQIKQALKDGFTEEQIVEGFGDAPLAAVKSAKGRVDKMGVIDTAVAKGKDMLAGGDLAIRQMRANDGTPEAQRLLAEKQARDADPYRRALNDTTTASVVGAAPQVGAAIASVPFTGPFGTAAIMAGTGAAGEALTPQNSNSERFSNAATTGAIDGTIGAAVPLAGRAISKGFNAAKGAGQSIGDKIIGTTQQEIRGAMSKEARAALADQNSKTLTVELLKRAGAKEANAIDSNLVKELEANAYKDSNALLEKFVLPKEAATIGDDIANIGSKYEKEVLTADRSDLVSKYVSDFRKRLETGNITGPELVNWQRSLGRSAVDSQGATRTALNDLKSQINGLIERYSPEAKAALDKDNNQYRKQLIVEKLVKLTDNSGEITPKKLNQAIKSTSGKSYAKGQAPMQDLAELAIQANVDDVAARPLAKALNNDSVGVGTAAAVALDPSIGGLSYAARSLAKKLLNNGANKRVQSLADLLEQTPTAGKKSSIDNATKSYIARALGQNSKQD